MISPCPHCGKKYRVDETASGRQMTCPACERPFTIPTSSGEAKNEPDAQKTPQASNVRSASKSPSGRSAPAFQVAPIQQQKTPDNRGLRRIVVLAACIVCAISIAAGAVAYFMMTGESGPPEVYVVPYVGDIDGGIDEDWFSFYEQLVKWHDDNSMPGNFSLYPDTMNNDRFNKIVGDMHISKNVELIIKGEAEYDGRKIDDMSNAEVKQALEACRSRFVTELGKLGYSGIDAPVAYNQLMMGFNETIRDAAREVGFEIYLDHAEGSHGYIDILPDFDVTQYSVSFTISGQAGAGENFKGAEQIFTELLEFEHERMLYINGIKVVPLLCHQQDFRTAEDSSVIDKEKWAVYTSLLVKAKKDPRIHLLRAGQVYDLRHVSDL